MCIRMCVKFPHGVRICIHLELRAAYIITPIYEKIKMYKISRPTLEMFELGEHSRHNDHLEDDQAHATSPGLALVNAQIPSAPQERKKKKHLHLLY